MPWPTASSLKHIGKTHSSCTEWPFFILKCPIYWGRGQKELVCVGGVGGGGGVLTKGAQIYKKRNEMCFSLLQKPSTPMNINLQKLYNNNNIDFFTNHWMDSHIHGSSIQKYSLQLLGQTNIPVWHSRRQFFMSLKTHPSKQGQQASEEQLFWIVGVLNVPVWSRDNDAGWRVIS